MWTLSTLPDDTFALLLQVLPSTAVLALWKCGCPSLTRKLAQNVTKIELSDKIWHTTSRWPKLLSELSNLEHLHLYHDFAPLYIDSYELSQQIKLLSPKLRSLSLQGLDVLEALCNFADDTGTVIYTNYPRGSSGWMDFGSMFPHLESLTVFETARRQISYECSEVAALPDTITELRLNEFSLSKEEHLSLAVLPRNLEIFNTIVSIAYTGSLDSLYSQAPPNLRIIKADTKEPSLSKLPRSIEKFHAAIPTLDPTIASTLPQGLQELKIDSVFQSGDQWTLLLPSKLTTLELGLFSTLSRHHIVNLPKSITRLHCTEIEWTDFDASEKSDSFWPTNLLELSSSSSTNPTYALLPRTLKTLKLNVEQSGPISNLPPGLTDLSVSSAETLQISIPLPPKLQVLGFATRVYFKWLKEKDNTLLFPPSLRSLTLQTRSRSLPTSDVLESISVLPGLRELRISSWSWETLDQLPRSLTSLHLGLIASDTMITDYEKDMFANMPSNLESLTIGRTEPMEDRTFSARSFQTLPNLRTLNVLQVAPFPSSVLRHLPKDMWSLYIDLERLEDEDSAFLPQNAMDIYVGEARSASDMIALPHWPLLCIRPTYGDSLVRLPKDHPATIRLENATERKKLFPDPRVIITLPTQSD